MSPTKLALAGAVAAAAAAVVAATAGGIGGVLAAAVLAAISAGLYVTFQQEINNAKDPPKAHRNFREKVPVNLPAASEPLVENARFSSLRAWLDTVQLVSLGQVAISETKSRMMGARQAQDGPGLQLQTSACQAELAALRRTAMDIPDITVRASEALRELLTKDIRRNYAGIAKGFGDPRMRANNVRRLMRLGLNRKAVTHIVAVAANPEIMRLVDSAFPKKPSGPIEPMLQLIANSLTTLVDSIVKEESPS